MHSARTYKHSIVFEIKTRERKLTHKCAHREVHTHVHSYLSKLDGERVEKTTTNDYACQGREKRNLFIALLMECITSKLHGLSHDSK